MNPLDNFFGNPVQRIDAIMAEIFPHIKEDIRRQKVCVIEDIFRSGKALNGFCVGYSDYLNPTTFMFDALYDKDIVDLELILAQLSAELSRQARAVIDWKHTR